MTEQPAARPSTSEAVHRFVPHPRASVQGALALDLVASQAPPDVVPPAPRVAAADVVLVHPSTRREVEKWVGALAQAVVEVVSGDRPASQLVRWLHGSLHREVAYRAAVVARAGAHRAGQGRPRRNPATRPQVTSVHVSFTDSRHVEFCAVVRHGSRSRFLAGCIRRRRDRWTCTELEFG